MLDGQSSATVDIAAVDDSDVDGTQAVTLSAAAADYAGDSATLQVTDDDVPVIEVILDNGDSRLYPDWIYAAEQQPGRNCVWWR